MLAVKVGLASNILLAVLKTSIGIVGNSAALLADGINSTSDVAYHIVVAVFIRLSRKPPDDHHPLGHSQMESIAAVIVGSFVVTTAVAIFWDSVNAAYALMFRGNGYSTISLYALWVAVMTVVLKIVLTIFTRRLGEETKNAAVVALAYDHRNDIFSSSAAALGIVLGRMGYLFVDPLAGAVVALVILRTGIEILRESSADLMDSVPSRELMENVIEIIDEVEGVEDVEKLFAHRFGPYLIMNLTIGIDGDMTVAEGDRIASRVERLLYTNIDFLRYINIHYHPVRSRLKSTSPTIAH
ncbi:MAG: cation diffusion facilitator family transporter [Actinomycetota bacterium]|nr:cation diffusion facilitator family transporter [Actinomycetota bacterium]